MQETALLELKHFRKEHVEQLRSFQLPEVQEQFTSLPINYMEEIEGQHRVVITYDNRPVGFFILHTTDRVKEYTVNPNAMLLTSLSINHSEQGKGYAKQAMGLLRKFVLDEFPASNEIVLVVNHKNNPAQKLYEKVGFQDTGQRKIGPIGEQYIMNLIL